MPNSPRASATIYEFPAGGRAGIKRAEPRLRTAAGPPARAPKIVSASGWYHEAAMEQEREH
ncbi:MAG: DUF2735 domain-containing protein [Hyphomicrobiaceae bacterium]|nr:DUF2735 domain-containing protein [Hyphomicrobiaceae bacterium]